MHTASSGAFDCLSAANDEPLHASRCVESKGTYYVSSDIIALSTAAMTDCTAPQIISPSGLVPWLAMPCQCVPAVAGAHSVFKTLPSVCSTWLDVLDFIFHNYSSSTVLSSIIPETHLIRSIILWVIRPQNCIATFDLISLVEPLFFYNHL